MTNEKILKYFGKYNNDYDVEFNPDYKKIWWEDSYIREILNGPFLNFLDINDLNIMNTTLTLNGDIRITEDYVRLITKEEVEKLRNINVEVLKIKREYGYWTMTPSKFDDDYGLIFFVQGSNSPGKLSHASTHSVRVVRPVISLKSNNLITQKNEIITTGYTPQQLESIKRLQKLRNI